MQNNTKRRIILTIKRRGCNVKRTYSERGERNCVIIFGKLQRGKLSREECMDEIQIKLSKEGYSKGSILGVQAEFNHLADEHGDYKW